MTTSTADNVQTLAPRRKGYCRRADIPRDLLKKLNSGHEEPQTLAEWLAVDARALLDAVVPDVGLTRYRKRLSRVMDDLRAAGPMQRQKTIGAALHEITKGLGSRPIIIERLATHRSGIVREWAALMLTADASLRLEQRIEGARRFAGDSSMNVREIAWMSFRPFLEEDLQQAVRLLEPWTRNHDANIRRCAIESTRPRGVWCQHIEAMKKNPDLGLPLLENVRSDASRYVQLSLGNWLNDASKTNPKWIKRLCARWQKESPTPETAWIVQHALRTIRKAN